MKGQEAAGTLKPYEVPRLHVYGDIRVITRAIGCAGKGDGPGGACDVVLNPTKTS